MRDTPNIREIGELLPDMMGFIFYERSPRSAHTLDPKVVRALPESIFRVGVFVNENATQIERIATDYGLTHIQLHGDESADFCRTIARLTGCKIIKATTPQNGHRYDQAADLLLFDTPSPLRGGTGQRFDWHTTELYTGPTPWMLSGGLKSEHAEQILTKNPFAIDLNSGFETAPGVKNRPLLETFIKKIRDHEPHK